MNRIPVAIATTLLLAAAPAAHADCRGKADLGASFATGNSENQSAGGAFEVKDVVGKWTHILGAAANYGDDVSTGTAQGWEMRGQTQYDFSKRF